MASATTDNLADTNTAKIPKQAIGLMLAHKAIMEEDLRAALADSRAKARSWWQGKGVNSLQGDGQMNVPAEDDMGIHIGDINYAPAPPAPPSLPPTTPAIQAAQPASGLSNLAKAAVLGAATLGGGGIGAAAVSLLNKPAPAIQQVAPVSPDSEPVLQFFKPETGANNGQ